MLTSKERAELRSKANTLDTVLMVGKGGVTENVIAQAETLLDARELVKGRVLETAMHRYPQATYLIILGFVFGSMVQVFPGIPYGVNFAVCMATFAAGFCAIRYLSSKEN